jgi:drug/metabolite transporter (DMT)-like permease
MQPELVVLVLLAATMHASWNALVKGASDSLAVQVTVFGVAGLIALAMVPFVPLPDAASLPFLALSVVIHVAYYVVLALGYSVGDLSLVYPIARGIAPVLVTAGAMALENEVPTAPQLAGVVIVSLGILSLAVHRGGPARDKRAVGYAVLTGICIAGYTVFDGMGVRRTAMPLSYIVWLFVIQGAAFAAVTLAWRGRALATAIAADWRRGTFGGVIAALSYATIIWVMSVAALAPISALRETSVIIAALLGTTLLGESFGRARIVAAIVVCAGGALLSLAG